MTTQHPNDKNKVTVTIDNNTYDVHPGNHPVVELKNIPKDPAIPKENILCLMVNGVPQPLADKDHVNIKGGEVFASQAPSGGAS